MTSELENSTFMKACRGEKTSHRPVWLMRQAGRYMPEYREIRNKVSFLELCKTPDLAAQVTLDAARILNVDAAIIFADILLITEPMGFKLEFNKGEGPQFENPFRLEEDLKSLRTFNPKDELHFVMKAIAKTRKELKADIPLIGFAGAPFTVASYVIEGSGSKNFENAKTLMRSEPSLWHKLLDHISTHTIKYLNAQIEAGAQALQLFDSWIGALNPREYKEYVFPHTKKIFDALPKNIPLIHFGTGTTAFLEDFKKVGGNVLGIDFHLPLKEAWNRLGDIPLQGNLDPTILFSPKSVIRKEAFQILEDAKGHNGFVFNLGHGILPTTPVDHVKYLIDCVHEVSCP